MNFESWPVLNNYIYWVQKEQFQLETDVYEDWLMLVVESGIFRYRIGSEEGTASAGDLVLCPPGTPFHREVVEAVTFHFIGFDVSSCWGGGHGKIHLSAQNRIAENCIEFRRHAYDHSEFSRMIRLHLLRDLWVQILKERTGVTEALSDRRMGDSVMEDVRELLRVKAKGSLQLKEVAHLFQLTPVQLTRRFQAAFGEKPIEYLTSVRIAEASRLLVETDMTIDTIAESCGYESGFYLSRLFTRRMGMNPKVYRRKHQV